jgi:UDP-N-acetylglucosamine acyltransferase
LIDSRALVDPDARLGSNVSVGPWSIIEADVELGDNTRIGSHVVVRGPTTIGQNTEIFPFCSIGGAPQDKKFDAGQDSRLEIGDHNVIREYCSINRGTQLGGGTTRIGDNNWIMAYCHVAHDCRVGSNTVFANNATLAGHVTIEDHVNLGGFTGVHQFCQIGAYSFTGIAAAIVKDVPPFMIVAGNTARVHGLNREGLKRHGFSPDTVNMLRRAYKILYRHKLTLSEAVKQLNELASESAEVGQLVSFIESSQRGIVR